jgi:hypothetical protein
MKKLICAALALAMLSSCAYVETTRSFNGVQVADSPVVEHMNGGVWGFNFLPMVPLFYPYDEGQLNIDTAVNMVTREARRAGFTRIEGLQTDITSVWIPFTLVLWYRDVEVSCNAVR